MARHSFHSPPRVTAYRWWSSGVTNSEAPMRQKSRLWHERLRNHGRTVHRAMDSVTGPSALQIKLAVHPGQKARKYRHRIAAVASYGGLEDYWSGARSSTSLLASETRRGDESLRPGVEMRLRTGSLGWVRLPQSSEGELFRQSDCLAPQ
ncbi:hypothetical protein BO71DRAFT_401752 [Aspergillus ellipticus CBS 707.79]|uniref:Uncharacterized protein n=1 Tax=Aspergillus ellipticus CBS 707.79 TaxID=1448320 RepID=A0A319EJ73_9EURO|nr:hypothetical protein BO71DRAFT_401752 [Aspergillus ellipticus CBS 707.79]